MLNVKQWEAAVGQQLHRLKVKTTLYVRVSMPVFVRVCVEIHSCVHMHASHRRYRCSVGYLSHRGGSMKTYLGLATTAGMFSLRADVVLICVEVTVSMRELTLLIFSAYQ